MHIRLLTVISASLFLAACGSSPKSERPSRPAPQVVTATDNETLPIGATVEDNASRAAEFDRQAREMWLTRTDLQAAIALFRKAVELDPQPSYQFNLCYAMHQQGQYVGAREHCEAAANSDDERIRNKAEIVLADILKRLPTGE